MKERIGTLIGGVEAMQWLGTFHAIGARMLRRHAELAGLKSNFTILDADDQLRLMKQVIEAENIDEKRWPARALASHDRWLEESRAAARGSSGGEAQAYAFGKGRKLYAAISGAAEGAERRRFRRSVARTLTILRGHPDILADYRERFR